MTSTPSSASASAGRAPALRTGRSIPLRRVAADARRGERLGPVLLREGLQLEELTDEAIADIVEQVSRKNSPLTYVAFIPFGGAYEDVGADDTAFGGPRSGYGVYAIGLTETPEQLPAERDWVRSFWQALQPHASGIGTYVNTMVELDEDRIRASYGPNKYARLAEIKRRYDPDNLFHLNANIKPAG